MRNKFENDLHLARNYKKSPYVLIYEYPSTREKLEGRAKIVQIQISAPPRSPDDDDKMYYCAVMFTLEDEAVGRWVHHKDMDEYFKWAEEMYKTIALEDRISAVFTKENLYMFAEDWSQIYIDDPNKDSGVQTVMSFVDSDLDLVSDDAHNYIFEKGETLEVDLIIAEVGFIDMLKDKGLL